MKNKWILRLSVFLNILFISGCIFIVLNFKEVAVNSSDTDGKNIRSISIDTSSMSSIPTTDKLRKSDFKWPEGKKMALSFTFDDAALTQIDNGIPVFDKYGIKATFYVSLWDVEKRLDGWKNALKNGHEIGNHTRKHPCTVNLDFSQGNPLEDYTLSKMSTELYSENEVIKKLLGMQPISFAYPCGQTYVGRGPETKSYVPLISRMFETGRGYEGGLTNPLLCDMAQLPAEHLDGKSFEQIKQLIDTAGSSGKWLILAGHGISEGDLSTSQISTIEALCKYALNPANGIWVDNVHNVASYVREKRGEQVFVRGLNYDRPLNLIYSKLWSGYYVFKMKIRELKKELKK
jgi:peptidoglycan/xylan/chitin deacetylase (PgdA/CDA1 family)